MNAQKSPLNDIKVIDLSRVLAGPSATQILGDLGADIVKVENPDGGDDTRKWGPPFIKHKNGENSTESSYYMSANRNKRSIALDFRQETDREILLQLIEKADILVENFKVGSLAKFGLDYETLSTRFPHLIYCSITGFGQTGPESKQAGYDLMIQGLSGLMSLNGPREGAPYKVGVAITDLMAGMYAVQGILAALHERTTSGLGQHIDMSLFDTQLAWLSYTAQYYLTTGEDQPKMGNSNQSICPYQTFRAQDKYFILACGNDNQFKRLCELTQAEYLLEKYSTNQERVENRVDLIPLLEEIFIEHPADHWIKLLAEHKIPAGPVNKISEALNLEQTKARNMIIHQHHTATDQDVALLGSPFKFSRTPVSYRHCPPSCNEHMQEILQDWLNIKGN